MVQMRLPNFPRLPSRRDVGPGSFPYSCQTHCGLTLVPTRLCPLRTVRPENELKFC